jgi:hypothetical protein
VTDWIDGCGPRISRLEVDPLYGPDGVDDGYAMFGALSALSGLLGPHSNARGPNEFLRIPTARRMSRVIAQLLPDDGQRLRKT